MTINQATQMKEHCSYLIYFLQCQRYWNEKRRARKQMDLAIEDSLSYVEGCVKATKESINSLIKKTSRL